MEKDNIKRIEFANEFDLKMNEICDNCNYSKVAHEMKGIYIRRQKLTGDKELKKKLNEICDDFKLGYIIGE